MFEAMIDFVRRLLNTTGGLLLVLMILALAISFIRFRHRLGWHHSAGLGFGVTVSMWWSDLESFFGDMAGDGGSDGFGDGGDGGGGDGGGGGGD